MTYDYLIFHQLSFVFLRLIYIVNIQAQKIFLLESPLSLIVRLIKKYE